MKLSFSTLGCPGWSYNEIFATARDLNFSGIEIRGIGETIYAPDCHIFADDKIDSVVKKLNDSKMQIIALDSAAVLAVVQDARRSMRECKDYIDLAEKLHTPFIRVMPSPLAEPTEADLKLCLKQYNEICEYGKAKNVTPLMETNGVFCDSKVLSDFLDSVPSDNKGALWDIHHPCRFNNESPAETVKNLGKYIKHTHLKDSVFNNGVPTYKMMGYGTLPIEEALNELKRIGYDGFYSLEWLKRWNPELQEPGIVFAHFASFMGRFA